MKITMKKSFAVVMALVMCVSVLFGMNLSAFAADTNTVNYVKDGAKVYNWGERGTKAEFLSPMAIEFYSANGTTLDGLLALDGSASESGVPSSALFGELHELMESNHDYITSYNATKNLFQYTDCQNSGGKISSFYSGTAIGPSWDGGWNREHVWPNSKGDEAGNGENDLMMLRPTSTSENSSRGNKAYGTTTTTSYYNPNDEGGGAYDLRGDVARIILYQYVRWECTNTGSSYNSSSIFGSDGVIESQDVLLDWIEADPVDTWEMGRNDAAESILGTRNVFVDYPELAFYLFNESVPTDYTSPSGGTSVEGDTSGSTGDNTGDDTTGEEVVAPETATYVFSNYTAGTQYVNESLVLDDIVTATSYNSNCHFTTQLRMYNSNTSKSGGMVILSSKSEISSISLNAGYGATSLAIYSSSDGSTWSSPTSLTLTTGYKDFSVDLPAGTKYVKIENSGTAQARIASITLTFAATSNDDTSDDKVYVDSNGVIVSGSADAFPEDTTITVTPITSGDAFDTATSALSGIASKFMAYDVTPSATLNEGAVVKLTLDIPDGYDADHVCIAHIDENGVVELLSSEIDKTANTVSAEVEHFSTYAVVDTSEASSEGGSTETVEVTATIDFTTTTQRVSQTTAKQVWTNDGLTFTNDKASSTNNIIDSSNPVRLYAKSSVTFEFFGITKIYIKSVSSYSQAWVDSIDSSIATATKDGNNITITLKEPADTFTIANLTAQARASSITVYGTKTTTGGDTTSPVITAQPNNAYGKVEVSGNYIIATPNEGYEVSGYEIINGNFDAKVTQNGNNFTVETDANVTIQINFVELPKYTVQFSENETVTSTSTAYEGQQITLPEHDSTRVPNGCEFIGWATVENATSDLKAVGSSHTVSSNITFYAQYKEVSTQPTTQATITFDVDTKRISYSASQQVWQENGVTVTNDKGASTSNVNTAVNPVRFYASSNVTIACTGMTKIVITADNSSYANVWKTTIESGSYSDVKSISVSGSVATIEFFNTIDTFTVTKLKAQSRVVSMTITKEETGSEITEYTVKYMENGEETGSATLAEGTVITLPNDTATPSDKNFVGWATVENATSDIFKAGSSYTVTGDVKFYAQYTDKIVESAGHYFVKVTENQTDWTGTYLIVYEDGKVAFDGSLTSLDVASNGKAVEITDGKIAATDSNLAIAFTITKNDNGTYTIRSKSGFNIGGSESDKNEMLTNATKIYNNNISIDADGNAVIVCTYNEFNNYMRYNATSGQDRFRFYKTSSYTGQQPIALYKLDVADITGAQVTVGADLTMKYYVDVTNIENVNSGDLTMRFSIDGEVIDTVSGTVVGSQYVFDFAGLAPQRMTDNIKAELLLGDTVVDILAQYSVQQNAINLLADNPSDELTQFITDMLYYGAAAQKYTNYNTDNLATSGLEDILNTPSNDTIPEDKPVITTVNSGSVSFKSATVWFDSVNKLIIKVTNPTSAKLYIRNADDTLTELEYNESVGGFMTKGIKATDFGVAYSFELYENDTHIQTLQYSVNKYASSKQNSLNEKMAQLAIALYNLGQSAENL